jgi:hypothetical protein
MIQSKCKIKNKQNKPKHTRNKKSTLTYGSEKK